VVVRSTICAELRSLRNPHLTVKPEEGESVPAGAGDFACDFTERFVKPAFTLEAVSQHLHHVHVAFEFASEERSGLWQPAITCAIEDCHGRSRTGGGVDYTLRRPNSQVGVIGDFQRATARSERSPPALAWSRHAIRR
jgi:hypothetical protein